MTDPESWWGQVGVEDLPASGARFADDADDDDFGAPAQPEDAFDWGSDGPEVGPVDDLIKVSRRPKTRTLVAALIAVVLAVAGGWAALTLGRATDPTPEPEPTVPSLQVGALAYDQIAPGFSSTPKWTYDVPKGAKIAGTPLGLVVAINNQLRLHSPGDGSEAFAMDLTASVESMTTATIDGEPSLAWLSGGTLSWWSPEAQLQQVKAKWATGLSNSGGQLLVSSDSRTAVVEGGALTDVTMHQGEVALGAMEYGVVTASSAGLRLVNPDAGTGTDIALQAPNGQDNRPVRWAGVAAGFVAVVWSPVPSPGPAQKVTVALHRLDGTVVSSSTMTYQIAAQAAWMRTTGQQAATFERAAWNLGDGSLLFECAACTLSGGFGTLLQAADAGRSGFVSGGTLYPSELTALAVADGLLMVRDGSTVKAYPPA